MASTLAELDTRTKPAAPVRNKKGKVEAPATPESGDSKLQAAFIALYNVQGGFKVATGWTSSNCCFKNDANATNTMFFLSAGAVFVATGGVQACGTYVTTTTYQMEVTAGSIFAPFSA